MVPERKILKLIPKDSKIICDLAIFFAPYKMTYSIVLISVHNSFSLFLALFIYWFACINQYNTIVANSIKRIVLISFIFD